MDMLPDDALLAVFHFYANDEEYWLQRSVADVSARLSPMAKPRFWITTWPQSATHSHR